MPKKHIIGIDVGGAKCAVSLGAVDDAAGSCEILKKTDFPTVEQGGAPSAIARMLRIAGGFIRECRGGGFKVDAIGISCGGPLDSKTGMILSLPNLPDWDNIHIKDIFYKEFNIPVKVQNGANACVLAEWRYGAARGYSDVVFLTFGTGMGAGFILNGKLYTGANDIAESFDGFRASGEHLGRGILTLIDKFNPEIIVIDSIFEGSGALLITEMRKGIEQAAVARSRGACVIVPAALGDKLGDCAAVAAGAY